MLTRDTMNTFKMSYVLVEVRQYLVHSYWNQKINFFGHSLQMHHIEKLIVMESVVAHSLDRPTNQFIPRNSTSEG